MASSKRAAAGLMQTLQLIGGNIAAGGIIGVGEEYDFGARRDGGQHSIDIGAQVFFGRGDRCGAKALRVDFVHT